MHQNAFRTKGRAEGRAGLPIHLQLGPAGVGWQAGRTYHACEIAYVFDNIDRCVRQTGGGPVALALSTKVSRAWVQLARTGNPNHAGMPALAGLRCPSSVR